MAGKSPLVSWRARNMTPAMLMQEDAIAVVGLELEPTSDR